MIEMPPLQFAKTNGIRMGFYEAGPKMSEVVRRVDAEPRLAMFWAERFPFGEGWEG